jgi:hypothetical protein
LESQTWEHMRLCQSAIRRQQKPSLEGQRAVELDQSTGADICDRNSE